MDCCDKMMYAEIYSADFSLHVGGPKDSKRGTLIVNFQKTTEALNPVDIQGEITSSENNSKHLSYYSGQ